jgi:hypothetical protein
MIELYPEHNRLFHILQSLGNADCLVVLVVGIWEFRLTSSKRVNCISHALFACAVAKRLAAIVDSHARRLLIGDGDHGSPAKAITSRPVAVQFEDIAKQLMKVPFLPPPYQSMQCLLICSARSWMTFACELLNSSRAASTGVF